MTVTEKAILNKKLKTGFPHVNGSNDDAGGRRKLICRLRIVPKNQSVIRGTDDLLQDNMDSCSISDYGTQKLSSNMASVSLRKRKPGIGNKNHSSVKTLEDHGEPVLNKFENVTSATGFKMLDNQNIKGPSILDANKTKQCSGILRKLMSHKHGWVFNHPVDPVKLNIPDYFSIIQNPMDLGTVKQKLESRKYIKAAQFANDVRLTFANAMRYNPPSNDVHIMAKILNDIFSKSWKVLEAKWNEDHTMQDKTGRKTFDLGYVIPQSGTSPDSHCKQLLVSADCGHKRDATGRSAEMHLRKDADRPCSLHRGQASPGATRIVVSNTTRRSCDGDAGPEGNFGYENSQPSPSTSHAMPNLGIVEPLAEEHGSPSKVLRAAILKRRFADTILKAQQKKLNHGEKEDPEHIKREKERMEKMRQMERIKTDAVMKAAEEAIRTKEAELKFQREKEREAARLAVQQMEKTVNIDENYELLRDLQSFGYVQPIDTMSGEMGLNFVEEYLSPGSLGNPLERLGLFMKDEYLDEEDDAAIASAVAHADMEDGEIVSIWK